MRTLLLAAAVICGSLGTCCTDASNAQQQQNFNLRVCNRVGSAGVVAVIASTAPDMWRGLGWYPVADQECGGIGAYFGSTFYMIATFADGAVLQADQGDSSSLRGCISARQFDYELGKESECELVARFVRFVVPADMTTPTVTLTKN
jgi:hypothetical protein